MPLYENLGFNNHPFAKTNADQEPDLENYFVAPPFFDAVVGDSSSPSASVVLAPRGAGKTALRRMVESHAIEAQFLAVTYDRFEFGAGEKPQGITLQYHLRNIITRILLSYLTYLSEYPDVIKNLTKEEKKQLGLFVATYLGDLTGDRLQELLRELKSLPERLRRIWTDNVGVLEPAINFILKSFELPSIDLPDIKHEEKRLAETYKYQLELLLKLTMRLGFKSIYVLVDKIDETEQTGNNPEASYYLVQPLLKDLELLGIEGFGFKFFLWDKIDPFYKKDARPDRVAQYRLGWTRNGLKRILEKRLNAYSQGEIGNIEQLLSEEPGIDIGNAICVLANSSPRNMIRYCETILAFQAERNPDSSAIDFEAIDAASIKFSEILCEELYDESVLKVMQKIGLELFTINYVANDILKITNQAVRSKISFWTDSGAIRQVGTIVTPSAKKPLNFYCVVDPVIVRLIHRKESFDEFIKTRWLPCDSCDTDNLMNIDLYPDTNEPECRGCGRSLI